MTKREVLTRILEEGRRVFENGDAIFINGMLFVNYHGTSKLDFDYDGDTGMIRMIYMYSGEHLILCIGINRIERIRVSNEWEMRPRIDNNVQCRVNGELFICEKGGANE